MVEANEAVNAKLDELEADADKEKLDESKVDESPPGHMKYDEWIEAGKDPEEYKGAKAFAYEHKRNESFQKMQDEISSQSTQVRQLTESMSDWQKTQTSQIRSNLEAELAKATEDENVKEAIAVTKKLEDLKKPQSTEEEEASVFVDYRKDHPILNYDSDEFNEEFNKEVEYIYNNHQGNKGSVKAQERILDMAVREAKKVFPDLFKSPKNLRETGPTSKKTTTTKSDPRDQLKSYYSQDSKRATAALDVMDGLSKRYGDKFDKAQFVQNLTSE